MDNKWYPIIGYDGWYEINKKQQVRSLDRKTNSRSAKGQFIKFNIQNSGYIFIPLHKNGKSKNFLLHRLMAITFIPNPFNLLFVNHKNGIKTDNRISNLEWCTKSYNIKHAYATGLKKITKRHLDRLIHWNKTEHGVKVVQFTKSGEKVNSFTSMVEASKETGLNYNSLVDCVRGRHKTCGGFVFKEDISINSKRGKA